MGVGSPTIIIRGELFQNPVNVKFFKIHFFIEINYFPQNPFTS